VKDQAGNALASTFTLSPGFTTSAAPTAPTVTASTPADSSTGIVQAIHPTVTFSTSMDPTSITGTTVKLLDPSGAAVAQASGSPSLDATGRIATIAPAADLQENTLYRISVSGAKDQSGLAMTQVFIYNPGFRTVNLPPSTVTSLRRTDKH
jgi:hypothetical protein